MTHKCVLFDADGVVINSERISLQYQREYGVRLEDTLPFFEGALQQCTVGKADLVKIIGPWLKKWQWKKTVEDFLDYWFSSGRHTDEKVIAKIRELKSKGIICCLLTNQEKYRVKYMKENMGFDKVFDKIYASCDIGFKKPDSEYYDFVLEDLDRKYSIQPQEAMFFDDSQTNVDKAKEAGIKAYFYKDFETFEKIINPLLK